MGYVTIDETSVRVVDISDDPQLQRPMKGLVGGGTHVNYLGNSGRFITLDCRASGEEHSELQSLWKKAAKVTLISPSEADYNGEYHITSFTSKEYRKGRFTIEMKLIEDFIFNVTRQDFVNYTITGKTSSTTIDIGDTWNPS